ncbi:MAG: type II toxin-antitoxin system PemK/MazF family toxin [Phycisphaerae bacterium]|nr:type II toxin-antitoxin system PemK/MazF family toxin [Phycisphaerae bacterium]
MATTPQFRQGQVYFVDCPPIDGGSAKKRPIVLVSTRAEIERGGLLRVVVCTTSPEREGTRDADRVEIPSQASHPTSTSGLSERSWALPRWRFPIDRARLTEPAVGYVNRQTLTRILEAVEARIRTGSESGRSD